MRHILLLFFLVTGIAYAAEKIDLVITGNGTIGPYGLGSKQIVPESDSVWYRNSLLQRGLAYRIDYNSRILLFSQPLDIGDTVRIEMRVWPLAIKEKYSLLRPIEADHADSTPDVNVAANPPRHDGRLELSGNKIFSINIGNSGEPSLSQSLDLIISGNLSHNVQLSGNITDRNLGAGGGTASIDELDRVLLHLQAPSFAADFGNLDPKGINGSLLDFRRKLVGLAVDGRLGNTHGGAVLAFSPGAQRESRFFGIDGRQGPYLIPSTSLEIATGSERRILPGTEEVYVNGIKLTRGIDNDYLIDYDYGYITFTPRLIINNQSRISIKYQIPQENYRRSFYHSNFSIEREWSIGAQYVGEIDDANRPRSFDLGQLERDAIERAGTHPESSYVSGVRYMGPNMGNYELSIDSLLDTIYVYVGADSGSYDIDFSFVGAGFGNYDYAGFGKYVYVGRAQGSYLPRKYYPLAVSANYGSIFLRKEGIFDLQGELAISRVDLNKLSNRDNIRTGVGGSLTGGWRRSLVSAFGRSWGIDIFRFKARSFTDDFSVPGTIDTVEINRQYNLPVNSSTGLKRLLEFSSGAISETGEFLLVGGGRLNGDSVSAKNEYARAAIDVYDGLTVHGSANLSISIFEGDGRETQWNFYEAGTKLSKSRFRPSLIVRYDQRRGVEHGEQGHKTIEIESAADVQITPILFSMNKIIIRQKHLAPSIYDFPETWIYSNKQYQYENEIRLEERSGISGDLRFALIHDKRYYPLFESSQRFVGNMKMGLERSGISIAVFENVNGSSRSVMAREFVFVGRGKGDYRKDGQDFVPEPGGEYVQIIRPQSQYQDAGVGGYEIAGGWRTRIDGQSLFGSSIGKKTSMENDFSFENSYAPAMNLKLKHILPITSADTMPLFARYEMRHRTTLRLNKPFEYIRNTLNFTKSQGSLYGFEATNDRLRKIELELRVNPHNYISYLIATQYATDKRTVYSGNYDIRRYKVELTQFVQIAKSVRVELPASMQNERENIRSLRVQSFGGGAKAIISWNRVGRLETQLNYFRVYAPSATRLAFVFADGRKPGGNLDGLFIFRFKPNNFTEMEFRYVYKRLGDGYDNYNLRMEAKAEF